MCTMQRTSPEMELHLQLNATLKKMPQSYAKGAASKVPMLLLCAGIMRPHSLEAISYHPFKVHLLSAWSNFNALVRFSTRSAFRI